MVKDIRDLRDPRQFPDLSADYRENVSLGMEGPFHKYVDWRLRQEQIPDYPGDESLATVTAREYRAELQERADKGDKHAQHALDGGTWDEPIS